VIGVDGPTMVTDESFDELMARLRAGDDTTETMVFRRYVRQLIALAAKRFDTRMRDRADVENVVLSAFKSFFINNKRGDFLIADWGQLWSILAVITVRKCGQRRKYLKAARRDAGREVAFTDLTVPGFWLPDRAPTPVEAAMLTETVERLLERMTPEDREIIEQTLIGYTADEVAEQLDCSERTVRRVRQHAKRQLLKLMEAERKDAEPM
jgi:RNA polymerase sigma factor (sigma-70 family)